MSTIKLPELPVSPESVYFEGDGNDPGELVPMYSGIQMRAYAEEAVRQALAAQVPVAWAAVRSGEIVDRPTRDKTLVKIYAHASLAEVRGLALIPAPSPGHKPAPVDTSSGHSSKMVRTLWGLKERYRTRGDDALSVATRAMQMIRRSKLDPFERQQHDKLIQDFAALHERPPKENDHG